MNVKIQQKSSVLLNSSQQSQFDDHHDVKPRVQQAVFIEIYNQKLLLSSFSALKNLLRQKEVKSVQVSIWKQAKSHIKLRKIFQVFKRSLEYKQKQQQNKIKALQFHKKKLFQSFLLACRNQFILRLKRLNLRKLLLQHYFRHLLSYNLKRYQRKNQNQCSYKTIFPENKKLSENIEPSNIKLNQIKMVQLFRRMTLLKRSIRALKNI